MRSVGRGTGSTTGRGTGPARAVGRGASAGASAARQARAAADREMAEDPEYWDGAEIEDHHLDPDDGPETEDYAELPADDDELLDGDGLREDPAVRHRHLRPQVMLFIGASGAREYVVRAPDPVRLEEPLLGTHLRQRHERLDRLAAQLALTLPREALLAPTLRELYLALPIIARVDFAEACGSTQAAISRDRNMVVQLACGALPMQVLFWQSPQDDLIDRLERWPGLHDGWTRASLREASAFAAGADPDTVRQLVPWVRATASAPGLAEAARAQLIQRPYAVEEVMDLFTRLLQAQAKTEGPALDPRRGVAVRRRALLGVREDGTRG